MDENGDPESHGVHAEDSALKKASKNAVEMEEEEQRVSLEGDGEECIEENEKGEMAEEKPSGKGRGRGRKARAAGINGVDSKIKKNKLDTKEPAIPAADRPSRERKSIDRFMASAEKEKVKEFKIQKGAGTCLKDIPNIVFKLSKRKGSEEVVKLLHRLLYSKRAKQSHAKNSILQFSGYVWSDNVEKERMKVQDRLEKCVKESLWQVSDILDLNLPKQSKKEDITFKLLEFLESPHKTTDKLFQEEKQKSKRKKTPTKGTKKKLSSQTPRKKLKQEGGKTEKFTDDDEEDEGGELETDIEEESEDEEMKVEQEQYGENKKTDSSKKETAKQPRQESEDEDYSEEDVAKDTTASPKSRKQVSRSRKKTSTRNPSKEAWKEKSKEQKQGVSRKGKSDKISQVKEGDKGSEKPKKGKGSSQSSAKDNSIPTPSDEELRATISNLLQDADFSTVTFTDVVKQLGVKFELDLTHIKSHLKKLIQEEIKKIVDKDDGEDEDDDNTEGEEEDQERQDDPEDSAAAEE